MFNGQILNADETEILLIIYITSRHIMLYVQCIFIVIICIYLGHLNVITSYYKRIHNIVLRIYYL